MPIFPRALSIIATGALAFTAVACSAGDTANDVDIAAWEAPENLSGSLTLYSANPQRLTDDLADRFEELTGVRVEKFAGPSGRITARLDAEWDNPQADVVYLASWAPAARYASQGRTHSFTPDNFDLVHDGWADADNGFVGRDGSALSFVVNTAVAPSTPSDWEDFAAEEWRDLVTMPDPRESGTARDLITAMVVDWGADRTWELFDALFANGMRVDGANGPALDNVLAGSYAAVLGGVDYSAYSAIDRGEPLEVIQPTSGTTVTPRPIFVVNSSTNIEAAEAFVNFVLSEEGQSIAVEANMIPARTDVARGEGKPELDEITQLTFTWDEIGDNSAAVLAEFTQRYL